MADEDENPQDQPAPTAPEEGAPLPPGAVEQIGFDGIQAPIRRMRTDACWIAFEPEGARPFIVAPPEMRPEDVRLFVEQRLTSIRQLRDLVLDSYGDSPTHTCRYRSGDIAYLLGRPFVIEVNALSEQPRGHAKAMRGRTTITARLHNDLSLVELNVIKTGDYDQRRNAFNSYAGTILLKNARGLIPQLLAGKVLSEAAAEREHPISAGMIQTRPARRPRVIIDEQRHATWVSDRLIPYPIDCLAYATMAAA
ncbi:MAG: hypothetical protein PHI26_02150, partial [Atopobiaceae bacterium]|nr:hypothetical protein [Atopobiaceae bacterium]